MAKSGLSLYIQFNTYQDSPYVLEAYSDSDYAGSHGDRKSTTGGCQFLGRRLISWQCKKQTIMATSSTEAEYVAAANCCGQFLSRLSVLLRKVPPAILATIDRQADLLQKQILTSMECLVHTCIALFSTYQFAGFHLESQLAICYYLIEEGGEEVSSNDFGNHLPLLDAQLSHPAQGCYCRPTTTTTSVPVHEQGPSSDPNIDSSSRSHKTAPDLFTSTNVEDETMGGSFPTLPPRSTQAPPVGTTSGGADDVDKLTALSSLVST
ncbi:hypothetical protein Tco_0941074 [Tanacetum coccineum]|uniref:Uncharacterized protein n=1 Tax=Tanacetum coccineum TaxID=301880 RepID=A0ABQ5DQ72_9ASTR